MQILPSATELMLPGPGKMLCAAPHFADHASPASQGTLDAKRPEGIWLSPMP